MKYLIALFIIGFYSMAFPHCGTCSLNSKKDASTSKPCSHTHSTKVVVLSERSQIEYDRIMKEFNESSKALLESTKASLKDELSESEFESVMQTKPFRTKNYKK